jgi:hypothetical protein
MRYWAIIALTGLIGVLAVQLYASAAPVPIQQPPSVMINMDCCPPEKSDCPNSDKPDMSCVADAACMARCTFVQPALMGPTLSPSASIIVVDVVIAYAAGGPSQRGYPPKRPPKLFILV